MLATEHTRKPAVSSCCDPLQDFARVFVRCQSSRALANEEKFNGDPLQYHVFMRKVQDRILNIQDQTDPGHALQLLLESTTGRARKLFDSCIMLPPDRAVDSALQLLFKTFGSPAVSVKAHVKLVSEGPPIHTDECGLQDFYSELINCKTVVEAANSTQLLLPQLKKSFPNFLRITSNDL